jgi:hypothetical protein
VEATLINTLKDTVITPLTVDVAETDTGAARDNIVTGFIWPLARAGSGLAESMRGIPKGGDF